jgi:hypothetical protein
MHLLQPDDIDKNIVPRVGMQFRSIDAAYGFYARYAGVVGFGIKRYHEKHGCKWLSCVREGKCKFHKENGKRVRKKTTKRTGCLAGLKLRKVYGDDKRLWCVVIDLANLSHNHNFLPSPSAAKNFHCNKALDPTYREFIGSMHDSRVPSHCVMDMMAEMHDGPENVPLTRTDIKTCKLLGLKFTFSMLCLLYAYFYAYKLIVLHICLHVFMLVKSIFSMLCLHVFMHRNL